MDDYKAAKFGLGFGCLGTLTYLLIWLCIWGGIVYTAIHFIRKYW